MAEPSPKLDSATLEHRYRSIGDQRLHCVEAGSGPLVVLLRGFPEFWYGFRRQIPVLAAAGFRVVAPDLRGYNLSFKPRSVRSYGLPALIADVAGLIELCGYQRAHVVGHDWGAGIGWALAMQRPERVDWLPEWVMSRRGFARLLTVFDDIRPESRFGPEELSAYARAYAEPGALQSMINYYRAALRPGSAVELRRIETKVLVLWGDRDRYLGRELARPSPRWAPRVELHYLPGASHWIQHEQPEIVNSRLLAFFNDSTAVKVQPL